jgi:hypothetical protein
MPYYHSKNIQVEPISQTLTDLNDFISPSQACIKPVEQTNPEPQKQLGAASVR